MDGIRRFRWGVPTLRDASLPSSSTFPHNSLQQLYAYITLLNHGTTILYRWPADDDDDDQHNYDVPSQRIRSLTMSTSKSPSPTFNPPLAWHSNGVRLQRWCRSRPPSRRGQRQRGPSQQTSLLFSGVCKPTPGSTRIVSMQGSNVRTATGTGGGAHREPATDRIMTRVNSSAMQPLPLSLPSSLLPLSFALAYDPVL
jgi:hypothetical protein